MVNNLRIHWLRYDFTQLFPRKHLGCVYVTGAHTHQFYIVA